MRAFAICLASLAACYSPSYSNCTIHCASGLCPSGYSCESATQLCRADTATGSCDGDASVGSDAPNGDPDGDGLMGLDDNCPMKSNVNQADEDADGVGDVCDPCPPYASPADNKDSDLDGVGDGCDPDPITAGNSILVFDGFNEAVVAGGTATPSSDWTFGGGTAKVLGVASSAVPHTLTWSLPTGGSNSETVLARYQLNAFSGNSRPLGVGVITQWAPSVQTGIGCWVGYETTNNVGNLKHYSYGVAAPYGIANDTFAVNSFYTTDETRRMDAFSCSEKNAVSNLGPTTDAATRGPTAGLLVKAADATFQWVLIVTGP